MFHDPFGTMDQVFLQPDTFLVVQATVTRY